MSRRRLLFAVASLGFVVVAHVIVVLQKPTAELAVEMQSSQAVRATVFFDTGAGFNEGKSVSRIVPADSIAHRLFFPLPAGTIRSVRFHPSEVGSVVQIRAVTIQKPDSHLELARFDLSQIVPLRGIASITPREGILEIKTVDDAYNPQLLLSLAAPLRIDRPVAEIFSVRNVRGSISFFLLAASVVAAAVWRRELERPFRAANAALDNWVGPFERSNTFGFDRAALWFYSLCLLAFALFSLGKIHGSGISMAGASYRAWTDVAHIPLLGTPKKVRSDEWGYHTPTILNQLYRHDPLTVNDTLMGPGKAALLGNIPCRHFTQFFRPQFWSFFVLPADFAFSVYWQSKALLLLTGVFTLVLLVTRSSAVAAICALWYFFSAFTQWGYSWASLLPEMVGLFCWTIALTCYLFVGRNRLGLVGATIGCGVCAINFALCAYPPHQAPLVIFGVAILAGWLWHNWFAIRNGPLLTTRMLTLAGCWLVLVGGVMAWFYIDAKETFLSGAATIYPGQRSNSGGGIPVAQFLSHFLDFWKGEENFPPSQGNICEASGYLWLAPIALVLARPPKEFRASTPVLIASVAAFLLILGWMLFPVPAELGRWFMLNRVPPYRCWHALGLINLLIVGLCLAERSRARQHVCLAKTDWLRGAGVAALLLFMVAWMNKSLDHFFSPWAMKIASAYILLLVLLLIYANRKAFALCLLVPLVLANGLINPIDRGLDVVTSSSLFKAAHHTHRDWREGKWIVYSPWASEPVFLAATGIDVMDSLKIIPDRKRMAAFDPNGRYSDVINRSAYVLARPVSSAEPASFENPSVGIVHWKVHPLDQRLREIGVDRVAFAHHPPAAEFDGQLVPFLEATLPGLQIYHLHPK